ncbi:lectin-domain protein, putative [Eimeria praecox]|uniref:Lectin-domain protein, putative n=1 Tax=Eimeria praecox TaxID=51316 RepID=U6H2C2_9EIME|nr:lectin-domain protein, putative [Eimeria praecox]
MSRYFQRAFCAYAAAAALLPLASRGQDVPVHHNAQPGLAQGQPVPPADSAAYGYHHPPTEHSGPPPPPPAHSSHGYGSHDPSPPQHAHDGVAMGSLSNTYALWEQSSGTHELITHSWKPPLTQENLGYWDVAMSTVPSEDHIVLMPADANRTGQFWQRTAVPAVHFEVQFGFGVFGRDPVVQGTPGGAASSDGQPDGFAFWYVYEPYASVYPRTPEEQASWSLVGYKRHNGSGPVQGQSGHQLTGDQVVLHFVKMWSLDPLPPQHNNPGSPQAVHPTDGNQVVTDGNAHSAHGEQYGVFSAHAHAGAYLAASHSQPDPTVLQMLTSLGNQVSMLSAEVNDLRQDLRKLWGDDGPEAVKSLKSELTGFKDLFKRHSQQHTSALHNIHKQVEIKSSSPHEGESPILSRLTDLSSQLEKDIAVKHASVFLLALAALLLVVLFALCSWRKFRAIEKKHML